MTFHIAEPGKSETNCQPTFKVPDGWGVLFLLGPKQSMGLRRKGVVLRQNAASVGRYAHLQRGGDSLAHPINEADIPQEECAKNSRACQ